MAKYRMICKDCGSDDVVADAYASWNVDTQSWEVSGVYDKDNYCNNCDEEKKYLEKEIIQEQNIMKTF